MNEQTRTKFPAVFWHANLTELFERAAYYSMASFVVIYLGRFSLHIAVENPYARPVPLVFPYKLLMSLIYLVAVVIGPALKDDVKIDLDERLRHRRA